MATVTCRHSFLFPNCCTFTPCDYLVRCWRIMNLQDFINYKTHCPLCDEQLKNVFNSKGRAVELQDDKFCITINLKSLKRGQKNYQALIIVDPVTNDFQVEFQRLGGRRLGDSTPLFLIQRFKEFISNSLNCKVYSYCTCENFSYHSQYFTFDFKSSIFSDLLLDTEMFNAVPLNDNLICNINNYHYSKETIVSVFKPPANSVLSMGTDISLPLTMLPTKKELANVLNRVKNLLIFS